MLARKDRDTLIEQAATLIEQSITSNRTVALYFLHKAASAIK